MLSENLNNSLLKQLELLRLRSRRNFLGSKQGGHLSIKRGHGTEFSDYRQYEMGDNPRYIDWGVYARSEKLYIKRFQEEENLSVLIILDTSSSMNTPEHEGKWQMAKDIAMGLSYVSIMQQDTVSLAALGIFFGASFSGTRSIHQLARRIKQLNTRQEYDAVREVKIAAGKIRFPGVAVYISDFLMPLEQIEKSFNVLRAKNLDITAIQVLSGSDLDPLKNVQDVIAVDSETGEESVLSYSPEAKGEYLALFNSHNAWLKEFFSKNKIAYCKASTEKSLQDFFVNNLSRSGLLK